MCQLCAEIASFGQDRISVTNRPAHRLAGLRWTGILKRSDRQALHPHIEAVKHFSDSRAAAWKSPIVVMTSGTQQDCFVGIAVERDEALPGDFESLYVPEMNFASSWHGHDQGDVAEHYARMLEWLSGGGYRLDNTSFCCREEFPHDIELSPSPAFRLMLPLVADPR